MTSLAGTPAPSSRGAVLVKPVTLGRVIRSEWIKLRSVRSSWFVLATTVVSIAAIGLLVSYLNNAHWSAMNANARAEFNPVNQNLIGVNLAELTVGALGVLVATGEYTTGMIRATFGAVPRRLPVLVAKASVFAAVTFVVCLGTVFSTFVGGQALLGSHGISLGHPGALRAVVGAALYLTVVGVMGIGLGFLIRSTAGAIATLVGMLLVLPVMVAALPGSSSHTIGRYLPSTAGRAVFTTTADHAMLSPWAGFAVFLLYTVIVVAAAGLALRRRDT
jgi:ABC-2 type transport system permease protein